jgi:LysM repeat protein
VDVAVIGRRGEGQADGLAAGCEPLTRLGDHSEAKIIQMGEAILLDSDNADKVTIRGGELMKGITLSTIFLVVGSAPAFADSERLRSPYGLAASPANYEKVWVKVTRSSTLKEIADDLYLATSDLIALNDQSSFETILAGSWVAIPYKSQANLSVATRISRTEYKLKPPEPPLSVVRIRANESLSTFSRAQEISLSDLRSLNPGLDLARLAVGSEMRVAKASPRALFAIRPSGGASYPELPPLHGMEDGSAVGPDTKQKQAIRQQLRNAREQESLVALRKAEARRRRYRTIGSCTFDWQSWGQSGSGVRSVKSNCQGYLRPVTEVAVDCNRLKVSEMKYRKWYGWKIPSGDLEALTIETCANVVGASKPVYVKPAARTIEASTTTDIKIPICTGPAILCGMP